MGLSEGAGGALVKYGILAGLVIGGGLLIWNFLKDFKWPDFSSTINNIIPQEIKDVPNTTVIGIPSEIQPENPVSPGGADITAGEIVTAFNPILGIWTAIAQIQDFLGLHPPVNDATNINTNADVDTSGLIRPDVVANYSIPTDVWVVPQDAAVLGGYLYQVGWVSEDANQQAYPLWKDKYSNELVVGWDVNYIRSLENLLLSDIRLGEEGRHNWSLM